MSECKIYSENAMNPDASEQIMLGELIFRLKVLLETCGDAPVVICLGDSCKGSLVHGISEISVACNQADYSMSYLIKFGDYEAAFDGQTITLERKKQGI